ncbi:nuclear transport factor 2 family protein [Nocardia aobensis]|uniref:Nuclear transport factor 2 family protein n=1 Tax=Nocardia aobensis TaxID=257277 RepID=A0ABW6PEM7_9NOCA|nr:nuclear transport factor 2 family protein [Nocardia elegans]
MGAQPHVGREAIVAFFSSLDNMTTKAELLTSRVAGNSAAFHMRVTASSPSRTLTIEPIDVITVDDHGKITSLRPYWGPPDFTTT